jgi:hypothetical protein
MERVAIVLEYKNALPCFQSYRTRPRGYRVTERVAIFTDLQNA